MFVRQFSLFLAPSALGAVLSLVMVPITTYVLSPEAFGVFGLMNAVIGIGWTVSALGSSAVCNTYYPDLDSAERSRFVSTMLYLAVGAATVFCLLCAALWPLVAAGVDGYALIPAGGVTLSLATVVLGVPWVVAQDVITLDGKGHVFAVTGAAQALATAVVTVLGLNVWHLGVMALFVSALSAAAVSCIGAAWVLKPHLAAVFSLRWMRTIIGVGSAESMANVTLALQTNVERGFIASSLGVGALGLYVHAQTYRTLAAQALKAAARPIWPITLDEARDGDSDFRRTRTVWDATYLAITALGITSAFFGRAAIGWLTHGRFTDAADIVTFFLIFLLVQNAGKPQTAIIFRGGAAKQFYWIQIAANLVWLVLVIALIRWAGLIGGVLALIGQQVFLRGGMHLLARRHGRSPRSDAWILIGATGIVAAWVAAGWSDELWVRMLFWLGSMVALFAFGRGVLQRFLGEHAPQSWGGRVLDGTVTDSVSAG